MIVTRQIISAQTALSLIDTVFTHARSRGWGIAAVVTDPEGEVIAALRMDGVGRHILGFASDKAYTAALQRMTTRDYFEEVKESENSRIGLANRPRLLIWGGGLPIVHQGTVVGGLGVSGVKDFEDIECAEVALRAEGLGWTL